MFLTKGPPPTASEANNSLQFVRAVGHHLYIYIARLIIEHPREWLASLADYVLYYVCDPKKLNDTLTVDSPF